MEKTISKETLEKVKTLPRIDFLAFNELVLLNKVERFVKFKTPRTIFYDSSSGYFLYLNPYHLALQRCGKFIEETEVDDD